MLYTNILINGLELNGYVLEYNESEVSLEFKNHYNQEVFRLTELCKFDTSKINIIGISLSDAEIDIIKTYGFNLIIPTVPKRAVIYGAGKNCLKTKELLEACGCTILAITDSYLETVSSRFEEKAGVKIISREELKKHYLSEHIVVSVLRSKHKKQIEEWLLENNFNNLSCMADEYLYVNIEDRDYTFTYEELARSFFKNDWFCFGANTFFIYGNKSRLSAREYFIEMCRIPIVLNYISDDGFVGEWNGVQFVAIYDLLTEDYGLYHVWVENNINTIIKAKQQILQLGLEKNRFSSSYDGRRLFRDIVIDSRLGLMNNRKGYLPIIHQANKKTNLRIGILGNSTSDAGLYNSTSWSEMMLDILESNGINAKIYNAAYRSYTVEDELLSLSRYLLPLELDIIISYSGTCDMRRKNPYGNGYAEFFFNNSINVLEKEENGNGMVLLAVKENLSTKNTQKNDCYEDIFEPARHWVDVQQMMHSICADRGIRYIGVLQPTMLSKKFLTTMENQWSPLARERCLRENVYIHMHTLWNEVVESTSWAYDFTGIFDDCNEEIFRDICHVTDLGNKIIAERITEVILK